MHQCPSPMPARGGLAVFLRQRAARAFRTMALAALLLYAPVATGCYGTFPLTRAVYQVNGEVTDQPFVHSVVMWVFAILPVYGIATFVDVVGFNLVEFFTGQQYDVSLGNDSEGRHIRVVVAPVVNEPDTIELTLHADDQASAPVLVTRRDDNLLVLRDETGRVALVMQRMQDGSVSYRDGLGRSLVADAPAASNLSFTSSGE